MPAPATSAEWARWNWGATTPPADRPATGPAPRGGGGGGGARGRVREEAPRRQAGHGDRAPVEPEAGGEPRGGGARRGVGDAVVGRGARRRPARGGPPRPRGAR